MSTDLLRMIYNLQSELDAIKTREVASGSGGSINFMFVPISYAIQDGVGAVVSPEVHLVLGLENEAYGYAVMPNVATDATVHAVFYCHEAGTIDYDNWVTINTMPGGYESDTGVTDVLVHASGLVETYKEGEISGLTLTSRYVQFWFYTYDTNTAGVYFIGWVVEW